MDDPKIIESNEKEEYISTKRVERLVAPDFRPCIWQWRNIFCLELLSKKNVYTSLELTQIDRSLVY